MPEDLAPQLQKIRGTVNNPFRLAQVVAVDQGLMTITLRDLVDDATTYTVTAVLGNYPEVGSSVLIAMNGNDPIVIAQLAAEIGGGTGGGTLAPALAAGSAWTNGSVTVPFGSGLQVAFLPPTGPPTTVSLDYMLNGMLFDPDNSYGFVVPRTGLYIMTVMVQPSFPWTATGRIDVNMQDGFDPVGSQPMAVASGDGSSLIVTEMRHFNAGGITFVGLFNEADGDFDCTVFLRVAELVPMPGVTFASLD